jgi:hypothetical protein
MADGKRVAGGAPFVLKKQLSKGLGLRLGVESKEKMPPLGLFM